MIIILVSFDSAASENGNDFVTIRLWCINPVSMEAFKYAKIRVAEIDTELKKPYTQVRDEYRKNQLKIWERNRDMALKYRAAHPNEPITEPLPEIPVNDFNYKKYMLQKERLLQERYYWHKIIDSVNKNGIEFQLDNPV